MSVTIRPYVNGGWEADIHVVLPDGTVIRERKKAPASSNTAAERWADACERVLATHGKPKPISKQEVPDKPTLKEFGVPFPRALRESQPVEADRECREADDPAGPSRAGVRRQHIDAITTEDVQQMKATLTARSPKTVNNVLTTLSVVLKTAVKWGVIERVPCSIRLLRTPKSAASFYDFDEYERLVEPPARSRVGAVHTRSTPVQLCRDSPGDG